jgi:phosphatidylserine synthase
MATTRKSTASVVLAQTEPQNAQPQFRWMDYFHPIRCPANMMTSSGILCGLLVILFGQNWSVWAMAACIWTATLFDLFDGTVASMETRPKPYPVGHVLDMVNDLIAGVATMAVVVHRSFGSLPTAMAGTAAVIFCGAIIGRLVRYTVKTYVVKGPKRFEGCPAPFATNVMVAVAVINADLIQVNGYLTAGLSIALAAAMVAWYELPACLTFGDKLKQSLVAWEFVHHTIAWLSRDPIGNRTKP